MANEDNLKEIIHKYGVNHQLKYIQSEFFEFTESVIKYEEYERNKENNKNYTDGESKLMKEHIAEEIGDVLCMLKQFQLHYDISDEKLSKIIDFKSKREINRIKENIYGSLKR